MSDAATKEQVEAPAAEVAAAQEVLVPAAADAKMEETPAVTEAAAVVETSEEKPAVAAVTEEAPKEAQNGDAEPAKANGQHQRTQAKNNRKFDPDSLPVTDDPVAIRTQVRFHSSP
jgi:hypothetical protein